MDAIYLIGSVFTMSIVATVLRHSALLGIQLGLVLIKKIPGIALKALKFSIKHMFNKKAQIITRETTKFVYVSPSNAPKELASSSKTQLTYDEGKYLNQR